MHDGQVPCPHCGHGFSRTLATQKTRRRRQCTNLACLRRFTTYEHYADHTYRKPEEYANELNATERTLRNPSRSLDR